MQTPDKHLLKSYLLQRNNFYGFTLVELIVVISILIILSTIAIISLQNIYGNTRDSVRVSDLKSLQQGLSIFYIKSGTYPLPEDSIEVVDIDTVLSYQGYVWENTSRVINISRNPLDPKDKTRYIYAVSGTKKKAQLMGYLESGDTTTKIISYGSYEDVLKNLIDQSYADGTGTTDYSDRFVYVTGDKVWILVDENNMPVQETVTGTGINLSGTSTGYIAYFWGDTYGEGQSTGTGDILISQILWAQTNTIPCNPATHSGYVITALAHNETGVFTKPITMADGTATGALSITCINGSLDISNAVETIDVSCNPDFVNTGDNACVPDICGSTIPTDAEMIIWTTQTIDQNWTHALGAGVCTFACKTNYTYGTGTNTCDANSQITLACNGSVVPNSSDNSTATTWTQTWNGTEWLPVYTYAHNAIPDICTFACDTGYTWNGTDEVCTLDTYTISGSFWITASGATIDVCGTSVTATSTGTFTATSNYGSVCNTVSATKSGYTCSTTTNGPAILTTNITNIAGNCSPNSCTGTLWGTINSGSGVTAYQTATVPYGNTCTSETRNCTAGTLSWTYAFTGCTVDTNYCTLDSPAEGVLDCVLEL